MSLPECNDEIINHIAQPIDDAAITSTIYDLSGKVEQMRSAKITAGADACTSAFALDWPSTGAHLVRLELRDKHGRLLSQNTYWHARDEHQLQELNSMPKIE